MAPIFRRHRHDRNNSHGSRASVAVAIASLPLLRIIAELSVGIEIDFINAGPLRGAWLGVPRVGAQLDSAKFLHRQARPNTPTRWGQRLDTITTSSELITGDMQAA